LGLSNYFGNDADYHSAYPFQERFPIKRPGCKGLKLSEPSSARYFAPINPFDALSLCQGRPHFDALSLGHRRPHSKLSLGHGKPAGEEENGPGHNADHGSGDTTGIFKHRCPH
jgi:hypothetical protein